MPPTTEKPAKSPKQVNGGGTASRTAGLRPPWQPGQSGNPTGRVAGDGKMRKLMAKTLKMSQREAIAALNRRWGSVKYVQDMAEFLAKLEGELTKESGEASRGIAVIILQNNGASPLDPEVFREAARRKALEGRDGA